MKNEVLARKYARAFLAAAKDDAGALDEALSDVTETLLSQEVSRIFLHPGIGEAAKKDLVHRLLAEDDPRLTRFLDVVIEHRREAFLGSIAACFHEEALRRNGFTETVIESARELTKEEADHLVQALEVRIAGKVAPKYRVAPQIIGGVRVRYADRMIDATVQGQLLNMKRQLLQNESR